MENIKMFNNLEFGDVRTIYDELEDEVWFAAKDITDVLELSNPTVAIQNLEGFERTKFSLGPQGEMNFINESGMYALIIRSRKPQAKKFRIWITSEVLPSIRKHGAYMTDKTIDDLIQNPDMIIKLATELKNEREKVTKQKQIIGELKPKADYTDTILKNKGLVTITQIAKDYGMSGMAMNKKLHELKVQYKQSDQWLLYSEYHRKGYTHSETVEIVKKDGTQDIKMNTKWTQKGRLFLYNLLKQDGVIPTIEQ